MNFRPLFRPKVLVACLAMAGLPAISAAPPSAAARKIGAKLDTMVIPKVDFDETTLDEALVFLGHKLVELDASDSDTSAKGINFVDLRGGAERKTVTLKLERVPAREVLKYLCLLAGCQYGIESEAIVLTDGATRRNPGGGGAKASDGSPQSREVEKFLDSRIVEEVAFDEAGVGECVEFLRRVLADASRGKEGTPAVNFVIVDPALAAIPVTLGLRNTSARGILGYLMEKAGTEFTIEKGIIAVRPRGEAGVESGGDGQAVRRRDALPPAGGTAPEPE